MADFDMADFADHAQPAPGSARPTAGLPSATAAAIVGALYAHPHDDTPHAISTIVGDPLLTAAEIAKTLEALYALGLVHCAGQHWQLTNTGYRQRRAEAGGSVPGPT